MCVAPEALGVPMSRFRVAPENSRSAASITPCTMLFASVLIVPEVTAAARGTP